MKMEDGGRETIEKDALDTDPRVSVFVFLDEWNYNHKYNIVSCVCMYVRVYRGRGRAVYAVSNKRILLLIITTTTTMILATQGSRVLEEKEIRRMLVAASC